MSIRLVLIVSLFAASTSMDKAQQPTYTVSEWPQGISELPCAAFRQNAPDSWTLIATVKAGGITMSNVRFTDTQESKIIQIKCGKN
jgi:hypothetical protein